MPVVRNVISGANVLASAKVARQFAFTVPQGTTSLPILAFLQTNTLPSCVWYCIMSAGPANCTFTPQFAVNNIPGLGPGGVLPDWFPVTIPQAIVLGVPLLVTTRLIANMISAIITVPGGGPAATVTIILAASM
tara:strand:- start:943 stop:1344 length:402 start_codon:yes stop_codon:yes gene_type:complete